MACALGGRPRLAMTPSRATWSADRARRPELTVGIQLAYKRRQTRREDPGQQAGFWSEALSYDVRERNTDASSTAGTLQGMLDSWFASAAVNDVFPVEENDFTKSPLNAVKESNV